MISCSFNPAEVNSLFASITAIGISVRAQTMDSLIKLGKKIRKDAQGMTPVDTGNLKNSAVVIWDKGHVGARKALKGPRAMEYTLSAMYHLAEVKSNVDRNTVAVTFTMPYAVYVHEDMTANHKVGRDHYLTEALRMNMGFIANSLSSIFISGIGV